AAVCIQGLFRGRRVRVLIRGMALACCHISRAYRGFCARKYVRKARKERREAEELGIFHYHALVIQCAYRGWHSRRYNYSHARRKAYLREVAEAGEEMRAALREHQETLERQERERAEAQFVAESRRIAEGLHHLASTTVTPGVFKPGRKPMRSGGNSCGGSSGSSGSAAGPPTIRGVPVDVHLATCIKDLLRARGYAKTELACDLNGTWRAPAPVPGDRQTVQATGPYDPSGRAAEAVARAVARLKMLGPPEFRAGSRVPLAPHKRGITDGCPYLDSWLNQYTVRGVPVSQAELRLPLRESSLGRFPERPFVAAVGGNKSSVLPNKRFDVILEAEQTGGVVRRHLGRSRRYGVADTCDLRQAVGSTLLFPPVP
ncbi:unnamed protein product, partial [Phaeothamnion confervicola]